MVAHQLPSPGGMAPLAALAGSGFHVAAANAQGGAWSDFVIRYGLEGHGGIPAPDGSLEFCGVGQEWPPLGSNPIGVNPLPAVWSAVWTPSSFDQRLTQFELIPVRNIVGNTPIPPRVFVRTGMDPNGNPPFGMGDGLAHYDQVQIPIIPAPSVAVLGAGLVLMHWRRRRGAGA